MPENESLQKLLEFARKQNDDSAKKLGRLNVQYREAGQKLDLLLNYRRSYQLQLQHVSRNGMGHAEWRNFIIFIKKLDAAIAEQQRALQYAESNRKIGSDEYQACQRKLNAYDTVSQRHQRIVALKQKKLEQKEVDEFSSNRFVRKNPGLMK
ncbi:MAG: flagellar export protein FliJ [Nitrosomonas sp.]|nr:flagellar export protein FliJ [Nitrosomonas sp.]